MSVFEPSVGARETVDRLAAAAGRPSASVVDVGAIVAGADVQQMPSVAVDPRDPDHLVIAYMDRGLTTSGYAGLGAAVSFDAGATWHKRTLPLPDGFDQGASNPIVKFDDQGRVFVSFMAATFQGPKPGLTNPHLAREDLGGLSERALGFQANNGIFVLRSDDGGLLWHEPTEVAAQRYDGQTQVPFDIMPDLAIDTHPTLPDRKPNPNYGNLYVVWSRYFPAGRFPGRPDSTGGSRILLAVSADGGETWDLRRDANDQLGLPAVPVPGSFGLSQAPPGLGGVNWSHVTVGPEGDVYVSMFDFDAFEVFHSVDGGRTFTPPDGTTGRGLPFGGVQNISPASTRGLPTNRFRTQVARAVVADPVRPGHVYAAEAVKTLDAVGSVLDPADIWFSRSADYGRTWQTTTQLGSRTAGVLNDDNDGRKVKGLADDVVSGQALPRLAIDAAGNLALVWYDTRRDPANHRLDVFATVSTDGGATFRPNFRVSGVSFDADQGRFSDATGKDNYYLGDFLGLALSDDRAYAAWTDTSAGHQDIRLSEFSLSHIPDPANDRFEPNEAPAPATQLGRVSKRRFPKLTIAPGDEDWFAVEAIASGTLTVEATTEPAGEQLQIELWDQAGQVRMPAEQWSLSDSQGRAIGRRLTLPVRSGQAFQIRVLPGERESRYALEVQSLTADLGARVYGTVDGAAAAGDEAYYLLHVPAAGALEVKATPSTEVIGQLQLEVLGARSLAVLAQGSVATGPDAPALVKSLAIDAGQDVLLHLSAPGKVTIPFTLEFSNLDPYENLRDGILRFPVGAGASQAAFGDLDGDGTLDALVSDALADTVDVLLGNGDGTFQAPREFRVGASPGNLGDDLELPTYRRDLILADLNQDGIPDAVTANYSSSDVSILLGRGDGTFQGQLRYNATATPWALALGDINADGAADLVVHDAVRPPDQDASLAALLGRDDGSFRPEQVLDSPISSRSHWPDVALGDVDRDGNLDVAVVGDLEPGGGRILSGDGAGRFAPGPKLPLVGFGVELVDLNGDGLLDAISVNKYDNSVQYALGRGDGTFAAAKSATAGQSPIALAVADLGSPLKDSKQRGPPDGRPDVVVANSGISQPSFSGPAELVVLLATEDREKAFSGYAAPIRLAGAKAPQDVDVQDVNGDGTLDVVGVDSGSLLVVFGIPPEIAANDTPETARDLGASFHLVQPLETIVPAHADDYFAFTVPSESAPHAGDQVLDISALFQFQDGPGLAMEVRDSEGVVRGAGERLRLVAAQGERLLIHVFGQEDDVAARGTGTFTLVVNVLPQLVAVSADALLPGIGTRPGGPAAILVLTLQGDRLDPDTAENPANYAVAFRGGRRASGNCR